MLDFLNPKTIYEAIENAVSGLFSTESQVSTNEPLMLGFSPSQPGNSTALVSIAPYTPFSGNNSSVGSETAETGLVPYMAPLTHYLTDGSEALEKIQELAQKVDTNTAVLSAGGIAVAAGLLYLGKNRLGKKTEAEKNPKTPVDLKPAEKTESATSTEKKDEEEKLVITQQSAYKESFDKLLSLKFTFTNGLAKELLNHLTIEAKLIILQLESKSPVFADLDKLAPEALVAISKMSAEKQIVTLIAMGDKHNLNLTTTNAQANEILEATRAAVRPKLN